MEKSTKNSEESFLQKFKVFVENKITLSITDKFPIPFLFVHKFCYLHKV